MTTDTQNHIRDTITIALGALAGASGWADTIAPLAAVSPQVAHAFPLILAAVPIVRGGLGIFFRLYNTWYPPTTTPAPPAYLAPTIKHETIGS